MTIFKTLKPKQITTAKDSLRALGHQLRLDIISFLDQHPDSSVKTIYKSLELEQSVTSQHLKILRDANLVIDQRDGKNIFYRNNYDQLWLLCNSIDQFFQD